MSENTENTAAEGQAEEQFAIQKIYIKDVSFESPNAPAVFTEEWKPDSNLELNTNGKKLEDNVYEVVLSLTVTVKNNDKVAHLVEIQQAGIFSNACAKTR